MSNLSSLLGIDIGGGGIKVVELAFEKKRARLVTYGYAEYEPDAKHEEAIMSAEEVAKIIDDVCQKAGTLSKQVNTALPTFAVFSSIISLPEIKNKEELNQAVAWEAKKVVPMPLEEMRWRYEVLDSYVTDLSSVTEGKKVIKEKEIKTQKILITAAPNKLVQKYEEVFKYSSLNLVSLEAESVALTRSLIGHDKSTIMIIDIGAINTTISVIDRGIPILNRGIDAGGRLITKALSKVMGLDIESAEKYKKDLSYLPVEKIEKLPPSIEHSLLPIVNEVKYIFNLYRNQILEFGLQEQGIEKIILTGGASIMPYLPEYLSYLLNIRVYRGDPWARVIYPEDIKLILDEIGPKFAIAIGLAMNMLNE